MFELGEYTKQLHEKVGKEVYQNGIDILVTIGELSKDIAKEAIQLGFSKEKIYQLSDKKEAVPLLKQIAVSGDVILLKASNGMKLTEVLDALQKV